MEEEFNVKEELRAILRYYDRRLDGCTLQEAKAASRMLIENMELYGTSDDFAEFYGKTRDAVNGVIKRKMVAKPVRKVLYPFHKFVKIIPKGWIKRADS